MVIFKIPYDAGGGAKSLGAAFGPDAIEAQFKKCPWRGAEDGTPHPAVLFYQIPACGIKKEKTLDAYLLAARGTLSPAERGPCPFIALSGDNSASFYTGKVVGECASDPTLVLLDAHPDACDTSHHPHASWVRRLWEAGILRPQKTFFFGLRDAEANEMRFIKESGAAIVLCEEFSRVSPMAIVSNLLLSKKIVPVGALLFVVDIDVLDPSQAPGTGVRRAPGMELRQVLQLIREFGRLPFAVKVGEITEVIPEGGNIFRPPWDKRSDPSNLTVLAAEAILREMVRSFERPA